jgi:hypothetical protein
MKSEFDQLQRSLGRKLWLGGTTWYHPSKNRCEPLLETFFGTADGGDSSQILRFLHRLKPQSTISIESAERQEKMLPHCLIRLISGFFLCFSYSLGSGGPHSWGLTLQGWSMRFRISALLVAQVHCTQFLEVIICHPNLVKCCLYWNQIPEHILVSLGKAVTSKPGSLYPILAG